MCQKSLVQATVIVSVAKSSILKSQQYILNNLSLNRNTHRSRLYTDLDGVTRKWCDQRFGI